MSLARRGAAALAALALTLVAACTSLPPLPASGGDESFSGRLAVRIDALGSEKARAFSAAFDLRGNPERGALGLSTPLGSMLAQARWMAADVSLATPQGTRRYADLGELTREALGERVPVEAFFDWLHGRPWPGAPSQPSATGFGQLGWAVDTTQLGEGSVVAIRQEPLPVVTVRIKLDPS